MIQTGERAPDFVLPSRGVPTRFYGIAGGRPVALVFCGPESLDLVAPRTGPGRTRPWSRSPQWEGTASGRSRC
jgi:hypothetical protein